MDEIRLFTAITRFDFGKFGNITNFYLLNCLSKVYLKSESGPIRQKVSEFLVKVQNGKVKMSNVARVKAVEIRMLLSMDEDKRREIFDEVPQGTLPVVFQELTNQFEGGQCGLLQDIGRHQGVQCWGVQAT